jgi:hypothetical protein
MYSIKPHCDSSTWKEAIKQENGFIGISLDNPNMVGDKLSAVINWLNDNAYFSQIKISLSDTLNRYNIMLLDNISENEARKKALHKGNQWLKQNQHIIYKLKFPFEIIRWDS